MQSTDSIQVFNEDYGEPRFKDVNPIDKTLMEKISLIDSLDKKEKAAFFTMLDALVAKKKLKDNLSSVLQGV